MLGERARHRARRLLGLAWTAAKYADPALGYAAKIYPHVAPIFAPLAEQPLGCDRAVQLHRGLTNPFAARERGHQLLGSLTGAYNQL